MVTRAKPRAYALMSWSVATYATVNSNIHTVKRAAWVCSYVCLFGGFIPNQMYVHRSSEMVGIHTQINTCVLHTYIINIIVRQVCCSYVHNNVDQTITYYVRKPLTVD